jgi:hypothetical protein
MLASANRANPLIHLRGRYRCRSGSAVGGSFPDELEAPFRSIALHPFGPGKDSIPFFPK